VSNYLAVATVTAALAGVVREAMQSVPNLSNVPDVRIARPLPDPNFVGAHLFLYRVAPNGFLRNEDLPTRDGDNRLVQRPRTPLDLEYLLTFYGNEQSFEPQRLLGRVVTALHAAPTLGPDRIRRTIANTPSLIGSDLDREAQPVRFVPLTLDLEQLSRMWSVFYQVPYNVSLAYAGSLVWLDAEGTPEPARPITQVGGSVSPRLPEIDAIAPPRPVAGADRALTITGSDFETSGSFVRFGDTVVATTAASATAVTVPTPPVGGAMSVAVGGDGAMTSPPASVVIAPWLGSTVVAHTVNARCTTLAVTTSVAPTPRRRYTFLLYTLDGGVSAEYDALLTWIDAAYASTLDGGSLDAALSDALNVAIAAPAGMTVARGDAVTVTTSGEAWRVHANGHDLVVQRDGSVLAVAWGLPPGGTTLACVVPTALRGRYAVALRVDDDARATSPILQGTKAFTLTGEPAPRDGAPPSPAIRAAFAKANVAVPDAARVVQPLPDDGWLVVDPAQVQPLGWLLAETGGTSGYALSASGETIAPVVLVPA